MGYSRSKKSIRKVESYLQQLVESEDGLTFQVEDASRFAYYLREGIYASKYYIEEKYKKFHLLGERFVIRTKGDLVIAEKREGLTATALRPEQVKVHIPDVSNTLSIIGAAVMHNAHCMVFPDANEDTIDKTILLSWCEKKGYTAIIADNHVTMTRI